MPRASDARRSLAPLAATLTLLVLPGLGACDRLAGQLRDFLTSSGDEETAAVSRKR